MLKWLAKQKYHHEHINTKLSKIFYRGAWSVGWGEEGEKSRVVSTESCSVLVVAVHACLAIIARCCSCIGFGFPASSVQFNCKIEIGNRECACIFALNWIARAFSHGHMAILRFVCHSLLYVLVHMEQLAREFKLLLSYFVLFIYQVKGQKVWLSHAKFLLSSLWNIV